MKISRVQIENYRNLRNVDVTLENIVTLIGENNSGKSNFLRAIALPLASDDNNSNKRLSWYDINREAKAIYYNFIKVNKDAILDGTFDKDDFIATIPTVTITLTFQPEDTEHYDIKNILVVEDVNEDVGLITYHFYVKDIEKLIEHIRAVLQNNDDDDNVQMSLLPMESYSYSLTSNKSGNNIPHETYTRFRSVSLPAERDSFASNADRLGSKALIDILKDGLKPDSQGKIERKYTEFFKTVQEEGQLDNVLNWQKYTDIPHANDFFQKINILPNMPQISSILGSIRLGYDNDNMFEQGLGHRNLVLMAVILNSYLNEEHEISFRLVTVEEPEAHLCNSNVLLMTNLFNIFSHKNKYTQIIYSTHNTEFVNKLGLEKVIVFHNGVAYNLGKELSDDDRDYLTKNPNTDILTVLYSKKIILVEGLTEELLIKAYLQTHRVLNDIKVLSFHKGYTKIIDIWKKINAGSDNKLGVVRDFDNQPEAQEQHEEAQSDQVIVRTTSRYTLETDIANDNYQLLIEKYGELYGWDNMSVEELDADWRTKKSDVILRICHDLMLNQLDGFIMPRHIQEVIDFIQGARDEN